MEIILEILYCGPKGARLIDDGEICEGTEALELGRDRYAGRRRFDAIFVADTPRASQLFAALATGAEWRDLHSVNTPAGQELLGLVKEYHHMQASPEPRDGNDAKQPHVLMLVHRNIYEAHLDMCGEQLHELDFLQSMVVTLRQEAGDIVCRLERAMDSPRLAT